MVRNVVLVVLDALRADRVGAISGGPTLTPNIDSVAADGIVFENAFTCTPNTDPSLAAIKSGRYPRNTVYHHGKLVTEEEKRRIEATEPVQQILADNGWQTVVTGQQLGRWHTRGFETTSQPDAEPSVSDRLVRKAYDAYRFADDAVPIIGETVRRIYRSVSDEKPDSLVEQDFIPTMLFDQVDHTEPFFGLVHLMDTHMPYLARRSDVDQLLAERTYDFGELDDFLADRDLTAAQQDRLLSYLDGMADPSLDRAVARYDAAVMNVDRKVGTLVEGLKDRGIWDETALLITSDHGESLLEHDIFFDHHGLYDPVFQVPLVCNLPRGGGRRSSEFVQEIDLAPTILDLLDIDAQVEMGGQSLVPLLDGTGDWESRSAVFAEEAYTERRVGVRTETWKYIFHVGDETLETERGSSIECGYCNTVHGAERQLYDLRNDPGEEENVVDSHPDVADRLQSEYDSFVSRLVSPSEADSTTNYEGEEAVLDRLESLGYK